MKATAIEVSDTCAVVELRPNWLARLFGARTTRVILQRKHVSEHWHTWPNGETLPYLTYGSKIKNALDFRPVSELPRATLRLVK